MTVSDRRGGERERLVEWERAARQAQHMLGIT